MAISLTAEQKKVLDKAQKDITTLKTEIGRAERAGLDVADLKAALEAAEKTCKGLKEVYGVGTVN